MKKMKETADPKKISKFQPSIEQLYSAYLDCIGKHDSDVAFQKFTALATVNHMHVFEYKADEVNWFYRSYEDYIRKILYDSDFNRAIFQGLKTEFVFDLFQYTPLRVSFCNRREESKEDRLL